MTPTRLQRGLPWALVALRALLAPLAVALVWLQAPRWLWFAQFAAAILSDVYDGRLARRFGVASPGLRQADSLADTLYALGALACFWLAQPELVRAHAWGIALVVGLEAARYPLDWLRFGRGASYHAWSARLFGLSLIPVGLLIMGAGEVGPWLWLSLGLGVASELEGVAISLVLPRWTHDVPHLRAAWNLRKSAAAGHDEHA